MRRQFEILFYGFIILLLIVRYADLPDVEQRVRPPVGEDAAPPVMDGELPRDIARSVVVDIEKRGRSSVGTAFAVGAPGTFVTARHVVDGCSSLTLIVGGEKVGVRAASRALNRDFAILEAENFTPAPFTLKRQRPSRGDSGYMMGFPQGEPADVSAQVIGRTEMRTQGRYRAQEPVVAWVERRRVPTFAGSLGGISGGPVFSPDGTIVGTVVAGAPRRGRVYTTDPKVFAESKLANTPETVRRPPEPVSDQNFASLGTAYRRTGRIAQVYCQVF